ITVSRLLKSCATPPARRPTASIFSASASRRSSRLRSLTSCATTSAARRPSSSIRPAVTSTSISVPSLRTCRQIFGVGSPGPPRAGTSARPSAAGPAAGGYVAQHLGDVLRRADVADRHPEELLARIAVAADRGVVDVEEGQRE